MIATEFAPLKRAALFFGVMGLVVTTLTVGGSFQAPEGTSSAAVAEAKLRQNLPSDRAIEVARPHAPQMVPASAGARMQAGLISETTRLR